MTEKDSCKKCVVEYTKEINKLQAERDSAIKEIGVWSQKAGYLEADLAAARGVKEYLMKQVIESRIPNYCMGDCCRAVNTVQKDTDRKMIRIRLEKELEQALGVKEK